ncbi:aspartate ammonia-lyase [Alteribacillus bidgolensis]|uniref:aspartate ammonia-lyase n=1 Tax=Alteribacillus bidgolensis TaxID=930129 RepID=A0A1G8IEE6_9BACI|nr:aspartate ammonia-lyase [Alteribacillus bidgolensis]
MEPIIVFNLLQSISIMNNACKSFTENCLKGIEANKERLKEYVEKSVGIITAINPHIGYEMTSRIAREAILTGKTVRELCLQFDILTDSELNLILNPYEMTYPGIAGKTQMQC